MPDCYYGNLLVRREFAFPLPVSFLNPAGKEVTQVVNLGKSAHFKRTGDGHNNRNTTGEQVIYLQHAAHPLEAILLGGVGPLLSHHHDPLVPQHCYREHRYPAGTRRKNIISQTCKDTWITMKLISSTP